MITSALYTLAAYLRRIGLTNLAMRVAFHGWKMGEHHNENTY